MSTTYVKSVTVKLTEQEVRLLLDLAKQGLLPEPLRRYLETTLRRLA